MMDTQIAMKNIQPTLALFYTPKSLRNIWKRLWKWFVRVPVSPSS